MKPKDVKARKRTPKHAIKRVHADRKLRSERGYRKHKGDWRNEA